MTAQYIVSLDAAVAHQVHQKALFAYLSHGRTLQLHQVTWYLRVSEAVGFIPSPGVSIYHPPTSSLLVRCANGTLLQVCQVIQQDRKLLAVKEW